MYRIDFRWGRTSHVSLSRASTLRRGTPGVGTDVGITPAHSWRGGTEWFDPNTSLTMGRAAELIEGLVSGGVAGVSLGAPGALGTLP